MSPLLFLIMFCFGVVLIIRDRRDIALMIWLGMIIINAIIEDVYRMDIERLELELCKVTTCAPCIACMPCTPFQPPSNATWKDTLMWHNHNLCSKVNGVNREKNKGEEV